MTPYYRARWTGDGYQVGVTTDGRDFSPIPRASFGTPRAAINYAELRQQAVSPLRVSDEDVAPPLGVLNRAAHSARQVNNPRRSFRQVRAARVPQGEARTW